MSMPACGLGTFSLENQLAIDSVSAALERGQRLVNPKPSTHPPTHLPSYPATRNQWFSHVGITRFNAPA